jgi:coproporphyrinogen III oxidase
VRHRLTLFGLKTKENTEFIYNSPMAEALIKNYTIESDTDKANNRQSSV